MKEKGKNTLYVVGYKCGEFTLVARLNSLLNCALFSCKNGHYRNVHGASITSSMAKSESSKFCRVCKGGLPYARTSKAEVKEILDLYEKEKYRKQASQKADYQVKNQEVRTSGSRFDADQHDVECVKKNLVKVHAPKATEEIKTIKTGGLLSFAKPSKYKEPTLNKDRVNESSRRLSNGTA